MPTFSSALSWKTIEKIDITILDEKENSKTYFILFYSSSFRVDYIAKHILDTFVETRISCIKNENNERRWCHFYKY